MLNRPLVGLFAGLVLGALDGLSALLSAPELSGEIAGIVMGSSFKGVLAGVITGIIARKLSSNGWGLAVGAVVAICVTAPIAYMNATHYGQPSYFWKIMLPGALVGAIVGFIIMRYGKAPAKRSASAS